MISPILDLQPAVQPFGSRRDLPAELARLVEAFHAGWFLGQRERLRDVLHPGLAKYLRERMPAARAGNAWPRPSIEVIDLCGNLACLRLQGPWGKVLLQFLRYGERWQVVNIMGDAAWVA